jgi:hypothetical protein
MCSGPFNSSNLQISGPQLPSPWNPDSSNAGNLYGTAASPTVSFSEPLQLRGCGMRIPGTYRTLDQNRNWTTMNCTQLDPSFLCAFGVIATSGWALGARRRFFIFFFFLWARTVV